MKNNFKFKLKEVDNSKYIIASDYKCKDGKIVKCFMNVNSIDDYSRMVNNKSLHKHLYEVIREGYKRKFYCDIDCNDVENYEWDDFEVFIYDLQKAIAEELEIQYENLVCCVYDSNTSKKFSYHLVLLEYYLNNCADCLIFYQNVMKRVENPMKKFLDSSVYTKNRCFRLLGCSKLGKNNVKQPIEEPELNLHDKYSDSVISYVPPFYKEIKVFKSKKSKNVEVQKNKQVVKKLDTNVTKILDNLDLSRFTNYNEWLKLLFILKGLGEDYRSVAQNITSKICDRKDSSTRNKENEFDDKWDRYLEGDSKTKLTIATLFYWLKQDVEEEIYHKLMYRFLKKPKINVDFTWFDFEKKYRSKTIEEGDYFELINDIRRVIFYIPNQCYVLTYVNLFLGRKTIVYKFFKIKSFEYNCKLYWYKTINDKKKKIYFRNSIEGYLKYI